MKSDLKEGQPNGSAPAKGICGKGLDTHSNMLTEYNPDNEPLNTDTPRNPFGIGMGKGNPYGKPSLTMDGDEG